MRVLFVDDERRVLDGIENALLFADGFDAEFANSGEEAIARLGEHSYDVLVTDMKMPGKSGADVVEFGRDRYPTMMRVMLSGQVDEASAQQAIPSLHEFIAKPCDPDTLLRTIADLHAAAEQLEPSRARDVLTSLDSLPPLSRTYTEIRRIIEADGGVSDVATVIESDVAVAAFILKVANSAFYGFSSPAKDLKTSVMRLGMDTVQGLVLQNGVGALADGVNAGVVSAINNRAAAVSANVRKLIGRTHPQAALAALLHDLGLLIIATQFPADWDAMLAQTPDAELPTIETEREILGITHPEIGQYLLRLWKLDPVVVDVARHQHAPAGATVDGAAEIIHTINAVHRAMGVDDNEEYPIGDLDDDIVAAAAELVAELRGEV